jgi:hypothetical protein
MLYSVPLYSVVIFYSVLLFSVLSYSILLYSIVLCSILLQSLLQDTEDDGSTVLHGNLQSVHAGFRWGKLTENGHWETEEKIN